MYRIGFQTSIHIPLSLLEQLKFVAENNINHFDIFFDGFLPERFNKQERTYLNEMKKKDISFSVHTPIDNYAYYPEYLNSVIDFTNMINAFSLTFHFDKISFKTIELVLKKLNSNIRLSIENTIPDFSYLYSKNYLEFVDEIKTNFKQKIHLTFDTGHCLVNGYNPYDYLKYLIDKDIKISTFHFHNNNGDFDSHHELRNGKINFEKIMELIKKLDYDLVIIIEYWNHNIDSYKYLMGIK